MANPPITPKGKQPVSRGKAMSTPLNSNSAKPQASLELTTINAPISNSILMQSTSEDNENTPRDNSRHNDESQQIDVSQGHTSSRDGNIVQKSGSQRTQLLSPPEDEHKASSITPLLSEGRTEEEIKGAASTLAQEMEKDQMRTQEQAKLLESKSGTKHRIGQLWTDGWLPEIAGCCLAMLSLMAILLLLALHQNKPLPEWPRLITINSLLSIFTTLLKAGLALPLSKGISQIKWQWFRNSRSLADIEELDAASRGPLGSLLLLVKGRGYYITFLGALLTVLALATDPFFQQVVRYDNCLQPAHNSLSTIARTNSYTSSGGRIDPGDATVSQAMAVGINIGIINPPNDPATLIATRCETGNCTFPQQHGASYTSVGMCFSCSDISGQIQNRTTKSMLSFVLPGSETYPTLSINTSYSLVTSYTPALNSSPATLRSLHDPNWTDETRAAFSCSINPCIKTYGANISQARLHESVLTTTPISYDPLWLTGIDRPQTTAYKLATSQILRNGTWQSCIPSAKNSTGLLPVALQNMEAVIADAITFDVPSGQNISWYSADCVWSFGHYSQNALDNFLGPMFNGQSVQTVEGNTPLGSLAMLNLWQNGQANLSTINAYMKNLTDAITSVIRAGGDDGVADYAYGEVMTSQTCAYVKWRWLTLPAILVLGVLVFLSILICTSPKRREQPLWKSSALALVFAELDAGDVLKGAGLPTQTEMEEAANSITVQLTQMNGRPQLS